MKMVIGERKKAQPILPHIRLEPLNTLQRQMKYIMGLKIIPMWVLSPLIYLLLITLLNLLNLLALRVFHHRQILNRLSQAFPAQQALNQLSFALGPVYGHAPKAH